MTETPQHWQELPTDVRKGQIVHELTLVELQHADPQFFYKYTVIIGLAPNKEEKMRIDIEVANKVGELRRAGKIAPIDTIQASATSMVDLDPTAMLQAFQDYSDTIRDRQNNVIEKPLLPKLSPTESRISDASDFSPEITNPVIQARIDRLRGVIPHNPKKSS